MEIFRTDWRAGTGKFPWELLVTMTNLTSVHQHNTCRAAKTISWWIKMVIDYHSSLDSMRNQCLSRLSTVYGALGVLKEIYLLINCQDNLFWLFESDSFYFIIKHLVTIWLENYKKKLVQNCINCHKTWIRMSNLPLILSITISSIESVYL